MVVVVVLMPGSCQGAARSPEQGCLLRDARALLSVRAAHERRRTQSRPGLGRAGGAGGDRVHWRGALSDRRLDHLRARPPHWGRAGAAGLLVHRGGPHGRELLLQHRARWSHHGGTWGTPGGALHLGEPPETGALREVREELGLLPADLVLGEQSVDDHGGWAYTTVLATPARLIEASRPAAGRRERRGGLAAARPGWTRWSCTPGWRPRCPGCCRFSSARRTDRASSSAGSDWIGAVLGNAERDFALLALRRSSACLRVRATSLRAPRHAVASRPRPANAGVGSTGAAQCWGSALTCAMLLIAAPLAILLSGGTGTGSGGSGGSGSDAGGVYGGGTGTGSGAGGGGRRLGRRRDHGGDARLRPRPARPWTQPATRWVRSAARTASCRPAAPLARPVW